MISYTPLRYPGGKVKIYPYVKNLIENNFDIPPIYVEAFAGGSGLALKLLLTGVVSEIYINDLDDAIYSFWYVLINDNKNLIHLIRNTEVTIENWHLQKHIYENPEKYTILEKGFSTFFLNRTNRSGIMKAGPIGGLSQNGNYKIDSRYNAERLINLIEKIYEYKNCIHVSNLDAKDFISKIDSNHKNAFIYLDPPYVAKGPGLYKNSFAKSDHIELKEKIEHLNNKWFVTYDDNEFIEKLFKNFKIKKFELNYSAATNKIGTEIAIYSNNLFL